MIPFYTRTRCKPGNARYEPFLGVARRTCVHAYTARSPAFLGTLASSPSEYRDALLMVAATVVDATDGVLARRPG